ncbi:Vegetative incompatibility protein HET-E-1 [Ceratocystis lukuohia]|uniref:Vegetative incompatibility protein HET-E-1 n=1 Tax=Ceratocystis lukuohia TaxID=2019550 RepID=A0ABR4MGQ0_9PEZI
MAKRKSRCFFSRLIRHLNPDASPEPSSSQAPPPSSSQPLPLSSYQSPRVQPAAGQNQPTLLLHAPPSVTSDPEPTSFLSQRERIWKKAYDEAEYKEGGLVKAFEDIVLAKLRDSRKSTGSASLPIKKVKTKQRVTPSEMQEFVLEGIIRKAEETSVKERLGERLQAMQAVRSIIEGALRAAPEAAAVWAVVSLGIEFLSNPITESRENRAGIQYVLCQMEWYWNLTDLLLDKTKCEPAAAAIQDELEKSIVRLFHKLLLYQMRSIRLCYRNWLVTVVKDVIRADDWISQLQDIKDAEEAVKCHMDQYNTQESKIWLRSLRETVGALARRHEEENDKQCISDLYITDPSTDKKNIEEKKGGLLKDSYKWILEHADLQQFLYKIESGILWIRGDPGKGKTMLLCGLIDELELSSSASISYFFCQATGGSRFNTATSVLRGLIYHLARRNPQLAVHVREKYDYKKDIFKSDGAWPDLCDIMTTMLDDPTLDSTILIVDALDECSVDLQRLLNFITKPSRAKWIVSSRNWPDIETKLGHGDRKTKIHLELNGDSVSKAVKSYINFKVQQLAAEKDYGTHLKKKVLDYLTTNAHGTFLWVALVCQELSDVKTKKRHTLSTLKTLPPGLGPLYERMLGHISESNDGPICEEILATTLTVYRPITLHQLHALVKELQPYSQQDVEEIIASCGSFLTLHNGLVNFVHLSAKDYLRSEASNKLLPSGIARRHQTIFERSLVIFRTTLKRDIYHLQAPGCLNNEISVPDPDPLASIQYSCLFWVDHFQDSKEDGLTSGKDKVLSFFANDYLHWLEALSLLKSISDAGRAMGKLQAYLQHRASQDLRDIVQDARLFLLSHGGMIDVAPLQVYISALIFSPPNSVTRQNFSHELPDWIDLRPRIEETWQSCLQTFQGHRYIVTSVVFSTDGQRLASGSFDNTVKIWDATSGACLHTLEGHDLEVTSLVFSSDGQRLASGSWDKTVKIWDASSGTCLQTLVGHSLRVESVVFSNDGQRLVSGSADKTVKIWDAASNACLHTLEGHDEDVTSVAFSNNGQRLASGSHDKTVQIWDAASGKCLQTLQSHHRRVASVVFSTDGQRLASASWDKTVKIWDAASGACLQTLQGHYQEVASVVFSIDGQRLASGSFDNTVKIWDAASGACLQTLEGHDSWVASVVFSNDGQRLASGSWDKTVKIWDASSGAYRQTLERHSSQVESVVLSNDGQRLPAATSDAFLQTFESHYDDVMSVAFSNNGQRLASGSADKTIKIWDAASGKCLQTLEGHYQDVMSVAFSNNGQRLASGSADKTVKIWDVASGACLQTLEGHDSWVASVVFSNNGQRLASGSADKTVKIWDATSSACLHTLEGHSKDVASLAFSNDGQQLASGSADKTVRIWDATSGAYRQTLEGHDEDVTSVAFSNNGQRLASVSADKTVKIWDVAAGAFLETLEGHCLRVESVVFSNDEQRLASGPTNNRVKIWDAASGECLHTLPAGNTPYYSSTDVRLLDIGSAVTPATPLIHQASSRQSNVYGYTLSTDDAWIIKDGQRVLYLPLNYRPGRPAIVLGKKVALVSPRRVLFIGFR